MSYVQIWLLLWHSLFGQSIPFPGPGRAPTGAGGGPIALIANQWSGAATTTTISAINCTGANFVGVVKSDFSMSAAGGTVTDSGMNTYTALTNSNDGGGNNNTAIWYTANASVSSTFTVTGTGAFPAIFVMCFSNVKTSSPFDQQNQGFGNCPFQTGSVTPSENNELIIAGSATADPPAMTWTIDSSFTITDQTPLIGATNEGGAGAYLIQTTAGAVNPAWNGCPSSGSGTIATFKQQ